MKTIHPDQSPSVLRRCPVAWRLATVATGVLPLCGAVRASRQPRHRLLSVPCALSVLVTLVGSVHSISWLMPHSFASVNIGSQLVKVVLRFFTNVAQVVSLWLMALRGPQLADLLAELNRALATYRSRRSKPAGRKLIHEVIVGLFFVEAALLIWMTSKEPLAASSTQLPLIFMNFGELLKVCRGICLVWFFTFLMQVCTELFGDISADIERIVRRDTLSTPGVLPPSDQHLGHPDQKRKGSLTFSAAPSGAPPADLSGDLPIISADRLTVSQSPCPGAAPSLAALRARLTAVADLTSSLSSVYAMPAVCYMVHAVLISMLVVALLDSMTHSTENLLSIFLVSARSALLATLLCQSGQRLEEAARRPAELLLRHPPQEPAAAAEAARLVALVEWLRPAAAAHGLFNINRQLLGSALAGYLTYMVVLIQMSQPGG